MKSENPMFHLHTPTTDQGSFKGEKTAEDGVSSTCPLGLPHGRMADSEKELISMIADAVFSDPIRPSREIAADFGLGREDLLRCYRILRDLKPIQDALTFESPFRRRVSFLRRELQPTNLPGLLSMFRGEIALPSHVEFHPALICNLRCLACPNVRSGSDGELNFLGYQKLGQPLGIDRLRMIQEMFLELGVRSFSFGGGGEPSLSPLTVQGIAHLRARSPDSEISLYTNGIFPEAWSEKEYESLVGSLNKVRFSIDAANAREWSRYKGRAPELFDVLWQNIHQLVQSKQRVGGAARIGASCLVSSFTSDVEAFLMRARDTGLDFCDIKEVETCYGEKKEVTIAGSAHRKSLEPLWEKVRNGYFEPLNVVVDDNLLRPGLKKESDSISPRCWVAIRGRMLTVGPYGELYPCSDAANPGSQYRRAHKDTIGQLCAFENPEALDYQFRFLWSESLARRSSLSKESCAYCVPSHNNFNLAVEKLYQDWEYGIMPEDQPFSAEEDPYLRSRGMGR